MYKQLDYTQTLGTGVDTIAESGALLVAYSNLLSSFGYSHDPLTIQEKLLSLSLDPSEGLFFGEVSAIEPTICVETRNQGTPQGDHSLVKLVYQSQFTGGEVTTYAAVSSVADKTIIDSYDGEVKSWDIYGGPVSFVSFVDDKYDPITVTPFKAKQAEPATYNLFVGVNGYASSSDAISETNNIVSFAAGLYYKTREENGSFYLQPDKSGGVGYWINPKDNSAKVETPEGMIDLKDATKEPVTDATAIEEAAPASSPSDEEDTTVVVKVIPPNPDKWKDSYIGNLGVVNYVTIDPLTIKDLDGKQPDRHLNIGDVVPADGEFTKDGVTYLRTEKSVAAGNWYGVPDTSVKRFRNEEEYDDIINSITVKLDEINNGLELHPKRAKALRHFGTLDGTFKRLFSRK